MNTQLTRAMIMATFVASSLTLHVATASSSTICDIAPLGCPASGTCTVGGTWDVGPDCELDFGARSARITGTLRSVSSGATFGVKAANVTLAAGKLKSTGTATVAAGNIVVKTPGLFSMTGTGPRVDASGEAGGGAVVIQAGSVDAATGLVTVEGGAGQNCGDAGEVIVEATSNVAVTTTVRASAASRLCSGGEISIRAASVSIAGELDAHGGGMASSAAITIEAIAGDVVVAGSGRLRADGTGQPDGEDADGGGIAIIASAGNVQLGGTTVSATGGAGGEVDIDGTGTVSLAARTVVSSSNPYGIGGAVAVDADGDVTIGGDIVATGGSSFPDGQGGEVAVSSGSNLSLQALIDVGAASGGAIRTTAASDTFVSGTLSARGSRGPGGEIDASSCSVNVSGVVDAGSTNGGGSGAYQLNAADVEIAPAGRLSATPCGFASCATIVLTDGSPIFDPGSVVSPVPLVVIDPLQSLCQ